MRETDRYIYNSIKEAENKISEIVEQYNDLMTRLLELTTETSEVKSQIDINGEIGDYYNQLIKGLKSLLVEEYESIEKEIEEERTGEKER